MLSDQQKLCSFGALNGIEIVGHARYTERQCRDRQVLICTSSYCMASAEAPANAITESASISSSSSCPSMSRRCSFASAKSVWAFPAWMTACFRTKRHPEDLCQPALQLDLSKFHVSTVCRHLDSSTVTRAHASTALLTIYAA